MMYSNYATTPYNNLGYGSSPGWRHIYANTTNATRGLMNQDPAVGVDYFLRRAGLNPNTEAVVRSMSDTFARQWQARNMQRLSQGKQAVDWLNYLAHQNLQQQFARLTPQQLHNDPRQFMRAVRTLSF